MTNDLDSSLNDTNSPTSDEDKTTSKEKRIEKERQEVLNRALSGEITLMRDRVAYILNYSNEARNSDIELLWNYWETFEKEKLSGAFVTKDQMKNLARISSLSRMRAKIQNEYKLFQADDTIRKFRGKLEEDQRSDAIEDKPSGIGLYSVYIDETGKNQQYLSVGSLWLIKFESMSSAYAARTTLEKWMKEKQVNFEFHFKDLSPARVSVYKQFFIKFLTLFPETGFKIIVLNNQGFADRHQAITDLTFHLINKGIEHENSTGRAPLPRVLQVWLDEEEKGSDQLKIENIKERLKRQKIEGLHFGNFEAVSSEKSYHMQMVDLFTASVNRKLHYPTGTHYKDEFADFVLSTLNFDITQINKQNSDIDSSMLFNLSEFDPIKSGLNVQKGL